MADAKILVYVGHPNLWDRAGVITFVTGHSMRNGAPAEYELEDGRAALTLTLIKGDRFGTGNNVSGSGW